MRKILLLSITLLIGTTFSFSQDRSIKFESTRSLEKIVQKAMSEDKIIFIDCYADWCGPCKKLAAEVFTKNEVADFFNEHFINVKLDIEKDKDGEAVANAWGVTAYPTLLFIDPHSKNLTGKLVGAGDSNWLLEGAKRAINPDERLDVLVHRFEDANQDVEVILKSMETLKQVGMQEESFALAKEWLSKLSVEQLTNPKVWAIVYVCENDPLSKTLLAVRDNKELFYAIDIPEIKTMVDAKLDNAIVNTAMEFVTAPMLVAVEQERYNAFIDYLSQTEGNGKDMAAIWLNTSSLSQAGEWKEMLEVLAVVKDERLLPNEHFQQYFIFFMQSLPKMKNKKAIEGGVEWIDGQLAQESEENIEAYYNKALLYAAKVLLLENLGKTKEATKVKAEAEKYVLLIKEHSTAQE